MSESKSMPDWVSSIENLPKRPDVPFPDEPFDWEAINAAPFIDETAWVAAGAVVTGRVRLGARSSVWYGCVLRGDGAYIEVGE